MLNGKNVLLAVTGGIAVYKAAALTSKLTQAGAVVKVMLSESAQKFVTPLTFQALSRNDVYIDTFDEKHPEKIAHIHLADWADIILVAPATANVIGKIANGIADNMITTTLLATTAPVWVAPAMNVHMYDHPAVQKNLQTLHSFGYKFIEPSEGYLACGYVGKGRLEEPEQIVLLLETYFKQERDKPLLGKKVIVTAGPTREHIDPVRFLTNRSTGKMGYAIAEEAFKLGGEVTLVSGPVSLNAPIGVNVILVETAEEMYEAVINQYENTDIVVKTAAVADYRPKTVHDQKMKKQVGDEVIELERTKDILLELGKRKTNQVLIGFAAETENIEEYAKGKLQRKNADLIIANDVKAEGAGFGSDTNIVTIYKKDGTSKALPKMGKQQVAHEILIEAISEMVKEEHV